VDVIVAPTHVDVCSKRQWVVAPRTGVTITMWVIQVVECESLDHVTRDIFTIGGGSRGGLASQSVEVNQACARERYC
jgi:hypothetical protein